MPPRVLGWALVATPAALLAVLGWRMRWVNEDGFIYFRVVDNLLAGAGPVFNVAERVEAYTSPAWLAVLALFGGVLGFLPLEWIAVVLGLAASAFGLVGAGMGALALQRKAGRTGLALPAGALVVAALPPFWDFSTSGLETGLCLAWLGGCFWALAAEAGRRPDRRVLALAALVGLGPLVRPDLLLFTLGFLIALLLVRRPGGLRGWLSLGFAAGALPVAYQIFRMGWFAALVPNTALAKEASETFWSRGWDYLGNFVAPYWLWLPLAVLALWWAADALARRRAAAVSGPARGALAVAVLPVLCGLVHALYVVRLGGDYMHGRMLLPSLFGMLLPVAVVVPPPRLRWAVVPLLAVVVPWAGVCALTLRAPARASGGPTADRFLDQRRLRGLPAPVTLEDYSRAPWSQTEIGVRLRRLAAAEPGAIVLSYSPAERSVAGRRVPVMRPAALPTTALRASVRSDLVAYTGSIGRLGYAAGPDVHIVDRFGLADPLAGRLVLERPRVHRAGHEKRLTADWVLGRFAEPGPLPPLPHAATPAGVAAARDALACEPLQRLLRAVSEPMSVRRFGTNLREAVTLHSFRLPGDAREAERAVCGAGRRLAGREERASAARR